jgi:hypothetical protein
VFDTLVRWGPGTTRTWGRPIAAPLEQCPELLGVHPATVGELAAKVEPYLRADGTRIWSLMRLERQLRPEAYGRRRGGCLDRRRTPAIDASEPQPSGAWHDRSSASDRILISAPHPGLFLPG